MRDLEQRLARWVEAGIVTSEQAAAILAAESDPAPADDRGPSLAATALGYLGAAVALVGGIVAASRQWSEMTTGARLALAGGATVVLLLAGFFAHRRDHPALRSLDSFLWFLSAAGAAFTAGLFAHDVLELETRSITFVAAAGAAAWGIPLWGMRRSPLQQVAVFAGLAVSIEALLAHLPGPPDELHGLPLWGLGMVWLLLGRGKVVGRGGGAGALGSVALLLGAQILVFGWRPAGLALGTGSALALLAASVALRSALLLGFGAAGVLLFLPQVVFEYLGDTLGAPVALLVCGVALLGGAFLTARMRGSLRGRSRPPVASTWGMLERRRAIAAAAVVALAVAGAVWLFGVAPLPDYPSLADRPDPAIPGSVAFVRWGTRPCVHVVPAGGGEPRRLLCASEEEGADWIGGPVRWTREGWIAVQAFSAFGNRVVVLEPRTGRVLERIEVDAPLGAHPADAARRADGAGILLNRSGGAATVGIAPAAASPREIARVTGPPGYGFWRAIWSPDGEWILIRDSNENLLVARAREGASLRLLAKRVSGDYAWHVPGRPGEIDLDSLRARAPGPDPGRPADAGLLPPPGGR